MFYKWSGCTSARGGEGSHHWICCFQALTTFICPLTSKKKHICCFIQNTTFKCHVTPQSDHYVSSGGIYRTYFLSATRLWISGWHMCWSCSHWTARMRALAVMTTKSPACDLGLSPRRTGWQHWAHVWSTPLMYGDMQNVSVQIIDNMHLKVKETAARSNGQDRWELQEMVRNRYHTSTLCPDMQTYVMWKDIQHVNVLYVTWIHLYVIQSRKDM